jgi:hypothetical protein
MSNTNDEWLGRAHGQGAAVARATDDVVTSRATLALTELERSRARWAQARGTSSLHSFSNWGPGLLPTLIFIGGSWIANAYVDPGDRVMLYLAYLVSMLTGLVFGLGWMVRKLTRRLDALAEIADQQR